MKPENDFKGAIKMEMKYLIGTDIGNAKTEIVYEHGKNEKEIRIVKQPSVVSFLLSKPDASDISEKAAIATLMDNLLVHITSKAIKRDGLFYIGNKALKNPENIRNMNIQLGNKHQHDIPVIMSLSMLAGIAILDYYEENGELPSSPLKLECDMATAIPSSEFTKTNAKILEDRFLSGEHLITVYVADRPVQVVVQFSRVKVTEEGKTTMLAFLESGEDILSIFHETYNKESEKKIEMSVKDFVDKRVLHADIGDGTTEFIYTIGMNPVPNGSFGRHLGVGHATQEAIRLYREELGNQIGDITRQHYMKLLSENGERAEIAKQKMKEATFLQSERILETIIEAFQTKTSSEAEFFFVHGGGSIVFKEDMCDNLVNFANQVRAKVVWIPKKYAASLNSRGCLRLAKILFENKEVPQS